MKIFLYLLLAVLSFSSCGYVCGYTVEQEVRIHKESENSFATYVWHNGEIVKSWHDPIDSVNSNLVKLRQAQADSLISALKNSR